ncbi:MAG: hypothetical protein J7K26_01310, partial [Candidatus Aenigmarchaeota archaeon]|nr:hypothetical protein [Candidatus Aenigmarchaeota archaeon]
FIILTYKIIKIYLIKRKIEILESEKNTLKKLIANTQRDYFEKGILSDVDYHIKIHKFGELIRDIDRQIPLLKEEIAKIQKLKYIEKKFKNIKIHKLKK